MDYVGETRTVDVHVGTLRMKLGECGDYIETVRGCWVPNGGEIMTKRIFRSICLVALIVFFGVCYFDNGRIV